MSGRILIALLLAMAAHAQPSLAVYSEFQRIDPFGEVVAADRGAPSREILSPAIARHAFASFHVAVSVPQGSRFVLYVGQNPDDAVQVTMYKELYEKRGAQWVPDRLQRVSLPYEGRLEIPNQTIQTFWMDLWTEANAPVRRIKVEPQLNVGDAWVIYPMEVRVMNATIPGGPYFPGPAAAAGTPADSAALRVMGAYLCEGALPAVVTQGERIGELSYRNAQQDVALARTAPKETIWRLIETADQKAWCRAPAGPKEAGPEWYLRLRDRLFQSP